MSFEFKELQIALPPKPPHVSPELEKFVVEHKQDIARIENFPIHGSYQNAQLLLVFLGEQPALNIPISPDPKKEEISPEQLQKDLENMGLVVKTIVEGPEGKWGAMVYLFVGKTEEAAKALAATHSMKDNEYHQNYGQGMGFPQTAIDVAVGISERLSSEHPIYRDPNIIFHMTYSKNHWQEESKILRQRSELIAWCAPTMYPKLVRGRSKTPA